MRLLAGRVWRGGKTTWASSVDASAGLPSLAVVGSPHEIRIAVPGDRSWCIDVTVLPAVSVENHSTELLLTWSDMHFSSGWTALSVAQVAALQIMPELKDAPVLRIEVLAQGPGSQRRRPQDTA